jgi:Sulfotransferase domain
MYIGKSKRRGAMRAWIWGRPLCLLASGMSGLAFAIVACSIFRSLSRSLSLSMASSSNAKAKAKANTINANTSNTIVKKLTRNQLLAPTPIIVMGLPKAGTTSIYSFFDCGMIGNLSHYDCIPPENETLRAAGVFGVACGKKMNWNRLENKSLFHDIPEWDLYSEIDSPFNLKWRGMILPQWRWIPEIHERFPNATWILNTRNPLEWLDSINRWQDLRQRFIASDYPPEFPRGVGKMDQEMVNFYNLQAQRVRDFTQAKPDQHHHLVELQIDSPYAGQVMEAAFGITRDCWGHKNQNKGDAKRSLNA